MLVYANHLCFHGADAEDAIFKAIGAWTKEQLGYGLRPELHREDGEYTGKRNGLPSWMRIQSTDEEEPQLYCWILKVADNVVRGRQWITELGVKMQDGDLFFSCVLRTDDKSTMVADPVFPSQPRVVRYVIENIQNAHDAQYHGTVPGNSVRSVGDSTDSFRGLRADIESDSRNYPIVLVSPDRDGSYSINIDHLQQIVIGLAQVVKVSTGYDSYQMEEILGRGWSAWDGAVNIIHIPTQAGTSRGRIVLSDEIESWGDRQSDKIAQLLAWVTNNTNIPRMRNRIRPEGVVQLALRRRVQQSRARTSQLDDSQLRQELESVWQLADEQSHQVNNLEEQLRGLEREFEAKDVAYQESKDDVRNKNYVIESLKENLEQAGGGARGDAQCNETMLDLVTSPNEPTPLDCLDIIEDMYGEYCVILESAKDSAKDMEHFILGRKLLRNLKLLVTEFRDKLNQGGDSKARNVFGRNDYAATESEMVIGNPDMRKKRTFKYKGKAIEMFRHLKIGMEEDTSKTIRVHFYWDAAKKKIVIGYCGKHLPVPSH